MSTAGRVLYVDDDAALARLVQRALVRRGHDVVLATDAGEGLAVVMAGGIDVVALDHNLPTGTGIDFLGALRGIENAPAVVYVTASAEIETAVAALRGGADDFVPKTVGDDFLVLLASALEGAIEKTRLRAARDAAEQDMREARERAEMLLQEVNHRVANSLALVSSLVSLQANAIKDQVAKDALAETQARIFAVSAVHKSLYTSGAVGWVQLDDYLGSLLDNLELTMRGEGFGASIVRQLATVSISTDKAVSVGIITTELATNAFKYAYPAGSAGEVRVVLDAEGDAVTLTIADDGPGWDGKGPVKGTGLGSKIIGAMGRTLGAAIEYRIAGGTVASVRFTA